MAIKVRSPDGAEIEFPEGTDAGTIQRVMSDFIKNKVSATPQSAALEQPAFDLNRPDAAIRADLEKMEPKAQRKAMTAWADKRAAEEKFAPNSLLSNVVRGTPVGSWIDEADGGLNQLMNWASGGRVGLPYQEAKDLSNARFRKVDKESTKLGTLPVIGDVTAGGAQKLLGGVMSTPLGMLRAAPGNSLGSQIVNSGLTGMGYGALYGSGEGNTLEDRAVSGVQGGMIGLGLGAALPPVARGLGNAFEYVSNQRRGLPQQLQQYDPAAVRRVHQAFEADDAANVINGGDRARQMQAVNQARAQGGGGMEFAEERIRQKTPQNTDEMMLVDFGQNLMRAGDTLYNRPGASATIGRRALEDRANLRPSRIAQDANRTIGPVIADDITAREAVRRGNAAATPFYDQFRAIRVEPTNQLNDILQRVPSSAYNKAVEIAAAEGVNLRTHRTRGLDGMMLDYIKRGVDQLADDAQRGSNLQRVYSNLSRDLRGEVDSILVQRGAIARDAQGRPITPNGRDPISVWEHARNLSGQGKDIREAIDLGNKVFRDELSANQLAQEMQGMTIPEREGLQQGMRNKVRTMQVTSTRDGQVVNPFAKYENRRKLEMALPDAVTANSPMSAQERARQYLNRMDAEAKMMATERAIKEGSPTEPRRMARELFPMPAGPGDQQLAGLRQSTFTGAAAEAIYRMGNALTMGMLNERRNRIATDAARMLFASGATGDDIIHGLIQYGRSANLTGQQRVRFENNVRRFVNGLRPQAVDAATPERRP